MSHLRRLELIPKNFGHRTAEREDMERRMQITQEQESSAKGKQGMGNPLDIETGFDFECKVGNDRRPEDCNCVKAKIKSGKYAKSNINLV